LDSGTTIPISDPIDGRKNVNLQPRSFEDLPPEVQKVLLNRKQANKKNRPTIDSMEGKYMLSIVLYLDKMSPVLKSDLYNDVSRGSSMPDKIETLRKLGILEIYYTARTTANVLVITDKGRRVASIIRSMMDIIENE
jgi:hypothetical protein